MPTPRTHTDTPNQRILLIAHTPTHTTTRTIEKACKESNLIPRHIWSTPHYIYLHADRARGETPLGVATELAARLSTRKNTYHPHTWEQGQTPPQEIHGTIV